MKPNKSEMKAMSAGIGISLILINTILTLFTGSLLFDPQYNTIEGASFIGVVLLIIQALILLSLVLRIGILDGSIRMEELK